MYPSLPLAASVPALHLRNFALKEVCLRHRDVPCRSLAEALEEDLEGFVQGTPFADDRTIVVARRL